jgi:hypothetical protein
MAVTVEIKTGAQRVITYLLSPLLDRLLAVVPRVIVTDKQKRPS